jgi:hypothetical protein
VAPAAGDVPAAGEELLFGHAVGVKENLSGCVLSTG